MSFCSHPFSSHTTPLPNFAFVVCAFGGIRHCVEAAPDDYLQPGLADTALNAPCCSIKPDILSGQEKVLDPAGHS